MCLFRWTQQYCDYLPRDLATLACYGFFWVTKQYFLSLYSFLTPFSVTLRMNVYCRPIHMDNTSWAALRSIFCLSFVPSETRLSTEIWMETETIVFLFLYWDIKTWLWTFLNESIITTENGETFHKIVIIESLLYRKANYFRRLILFLISSNGIYSFK